MKLKKIYLSDESALVMTRFWKGMNESNFSRDGVEYVDVFMKSAFLTLQNFAQAYAELEISIFFCFKVF